MEVAGWFATPVVERLINFGIDQVGWKKAMKEKLEKLQLILPNIQAVVDFASSQTDISNQYLITWLWLLRDAIDEADDVLDDFEYIKHEQQLTTKNNKRKKVPSNIFSSMKERFGNFKRALETDPNLKRLEEVVNKLDQVSAGVSDFLHLLQNTKQEQQEQQLELYKSRETGPLPQNDIIGRGYEKQYVMQWLKSKPSNEEGQTALYKNISLLSIVGLGGMGKTTLLQHVYEDVKITKEFPLKMWVCVSTSFDAKKVIADMLEYVTEGRPGVESLGKLQENLKSKVNSKKFLLVLDDIWEEEEHRDKSKWEKVLAPLASGSFGSKILITTRMDSVATMMTKVIGKMKSETLKVEGLKEKECLQLLNTHAFAGVENPDDHKKLKFIAEKMVKKLSGSPLAAKILGGVLNSSLDERHWNKVLNSDIGNIIPILRLSYTFLPKHLQSCFAFCCIFPQDHEFDKKDLVRMWIALGFIQSPDIQGETMEDIGGRYFNDLVNKSFFDKFDHWYKMHCYKMHDLLHELAQSVSKHECLRAEGDQELFSKAPKTIRHLFLKFRNQEELKKIQNFKNLRSLLIKLEGYENVNFDVITEIFNATRSIRLLYIQNKNLKDTFQGLGYLTHLRYFKVTCFSEWPTSLCNLYHLQFIISEYNNTNYTFPEEINNLSHLRYLKCKDYDMSRIREIGKLTSLQKLVNFEVKIDPGYEIGELEKMNDLRKLHIHSLHNVKDARGARNAKLHDKRNLTKLSLKWDRDPIDIDLIDENVLDNLQPPSCLKKLMIDKYKGSRSAKWMNTADFIANLEIIKLTGCSNWQTLPPFGQLRFLKSLHLDSMPGLKQFDNKFHGNDEHCVFPSLEMLHFSGLQALENWFDGEEVAAGHDMFPCLTKLHLSDCPNLQELTYLPPKLKILFIENIGWETLNCCNSSNLEELYVSCCPNLTNISLARLAAPRWLGIHNCPKLISLGGHTEVETTENCRIILSSLFINHPSKLLMELLRSITSVQKLEIMNNDELLEIMNNDELEIMNTNELEIMNNDELEFKKNDEQDLFPFEAESCFLKVRSSLLQLNFASLQSLQSLPSFLESLSSIETLTVKSIPELRKLPNLPLSLAKLKLKDLDNLNCLPSCLLSLSSLNKLIIRDVPQLRELPNLPPSLANLEIDHLDNLDCLPSCLPSLSSLKELSIINVPRLQDLPDLPSSLDYLYLENLFSLDCLPSCLPSLSSLKHLSIINVPQLQDLPDLPSSLVGLYLENLDKLDCLPSCLPSLSSLKQLIIENVPRLQDLPELPSSLEYLTINECHPDLKERYRRDEGSDWHKIAHIPLVSIY